MAEIPFRAELEEALKRQLICPVLANNSALTFAVREALRGATGIDLPFNAASNAIQASFCPLPRNSPIPPIPTGGQCPVQYRVDGFYTREVLLLNGEWESQELDGRVFVQGPITFLGLTVTDTTNGSPCGNESRNFSYRIQTGTGSIVTLWFDSEFNCGSFVGARRNINPGPVVVQRTDGQPDNCGNSSIVPAPIPIPPAGLPQPPFDLPVGNNTYRVSPKILIPFVNAKGELNLPVNIDVGGVDINFELNLDVEFNFNTGDITFDFSRPGNRRDPGKSDPRSSPPSSPIDVPVDPDKEPKFKEQIVGAIVTATGASVPASLTAISLPGGTPTVYAPYLGYVNFVYSFARGDRCFSSDIPVKNRRQFIPAPEPRENIINVIGSGNRGTTLVVTPVYQKER